MIQQTKKGNKKMTNNKKEKLRTNIDILIYSMAVVGILIMESIMLWNI